MERRSPPTARTMQVLELLTTEATAYQSLSSIARQLDLSPSTCLGILNELTARGYLVRNPRDRSYALGPQLVGLGVAAQRSRPSLAVAHAQITALSEQVRRVCTVSAATHEQITVFERTGEADGVDPFVRSGTRFPLVAPVGVMFVAWHPDEVVREWLRRAPVDLEAARVERLWSVIATCRSEGYLIERFTEFEANLLRFLPRVEQASHSEVMTRTLATAASIFTHRDYLAEELDDTATFSVSVICAPTYDAEGRPDYILSIYVMDNAVPVEEVRSLVRAVRGAAQDVTVAVGGRDPWLAA